MFTIFVVMALITTFATTPITTFLYPPEYQKKVALWRRGDINWDGTPRSDTDNARDSIQGQKDQASITINRITVLLRLENLPSIFTFVDLIGGKSAPQAKVHKGKSRVTPIAEESESSSRPITPAGPPKKPFELHGVRLVELDQRMTTVMQVSEVAEMQSKDPVVNVFRTFGSFHNVLVSAGLSIAPEDSFAEVLTNEAASHLSDLLLVPWTETGSLSDAHDLHSAAAENRFVSHSHNKFVSNTLSAATCSTAIIVDRGFGSRNDRSLSRSTSRRSLHQINQEPLSPVSDPSHHIFFPFFGGVDDHLALRFVLQLATNIHVTATIVHVVYDPEAPADPNLSLETTSTRQDLPRHLSSSNVPTVDDKATTTAAALTTTESATSSGLRTSTDSAFFTAMGDSLAEPLQERVLFETVRTSQPLRYTIAISHREVGLSKKNAGDLIVLGRGAAETRPHIRKELVDVLKNLDVPSGAGAETRTCLGDIAEALIVAHNKASVLVMQAGGAVVDKIRY